MVRTRRKRVPGRVRPLGADGLEDLIAERVPDASKRVVAEGARSPHVRRVRHAMTQRTSGLAEVGGGKLAWEAAGEGPGVAFLHPGLWDSRVWDEQFGVFSKAYRVLRHDFRGYGRSSRPEPEKPYSHVDDLEAVMDAAGVDRAALIGNSMGGRVAIDFALEHPSRVSALVLAAPGLGGFEGSIEEEARWEAWSDERVGPIADLIEAGDLERARDLQLRELWAPARDGRPRRGAASGRSRSTTSMSSRWTRAVSENSIHRPPAGSARSKRRRSCFPPTAIHPGTSGCAS